MSVPRQVCICICMIHTYIHTYIQAVSVAVVMDSFKLVVETEVDDNLTPFRTKKKRLIPSRRRNSGDVQTFTYSVFFKLHEDLLKSTMYIPQR